MKLGYSILESRLVLMGDLGIGFAVGLSCVLLGLCCSCYSRTVAGFGDSIEVEVEWETNLSCARNAS
ncbi:hypothetical protein Droror1_Dr00023151, partial [Drosera rotundifolia]